MIVTTGVDRDCGVIRDSALEPGETQRRCLSRFESGVPIHPVSPDPPMLTVPTAQPESDHSPWYVSAAVDFIIHIF